MTHNIKLESEQLDMLFEAIREKAKRCRSNSKMIYNSGSGKASTIDKAEAMDRKAIAFDELESCIAEQTVE